MYYIRSSFVTRQTPFSGSSELRLNALSTGEWYSVTYGNGVFRATDYSTNKTYISTDAGVTWSSAGTCPSTSWCVTYGAGKFVVVGDTTTFGYTSTDTGTFSTGTFSTAGQRRFVRYDNGVFIAPQYNGTSFLRSSDGITWTNITVSASASWYGGGYGNGVWIIIGENTNNVARSTDNGVTWTVSASMPSNVTWRNAVYGNAVWVATCWGGTQVATSTDNGVTWVARSLPSGNGQFLIFHNGYFVTLALQSNINYYSIDGITWTAMGGATINGYSMASNGETLVSVGQNSNILLSTPTTPAINTLGSSRGTQWNTVTLPHTAPWYSATYIGSRFVIAPGNVTSGSFQAVSSTDGVTWTTSTGIPTSSSTINFNRVVYAAHLGKLILPNRGANSNWCQSSDGGLTWTTYNVTAQSTGLGWASHSANGKIIMGSGTNVLFSSTDGVNWTAITITGGAAAIFREIKNYGDVWVAGNGSGQTTTSTDNGVTWSAAVSSGLTAIGALACNGSRWVACAQSGTGSYAYSDNNGLTWTTQTQNFGAPVRYCNWDTDMFYVIPGYSSATTTCWYSSSGLQDTWTSTSIPSNQKWAATFGDGRYVAPVYTASTGSNIVYYSK